MPIPIENNSWDYVQRLIEREINSAFKLRQESDKMENNFKTRKLKEDKMAGNWGNNKLYNMGLDGACIDILRKLTPEQVNQLVEILNELRMKEEKLWKNLKHEN